MARTGSGVVGPVRLLQTRGFYRGVVGGSSGWAIVYITITSVLFVRRVFGKHPEVAAIERLMPGQSIRITAIAPPSRRERKSARAAARAAKH